MRKYLPFLLILLMMFFIFGSSAMDGTSSNGASGAISAFIKKALLFFGDKSYSVSSINLVIRKFAHFLEYMLLTLFLSIGFSNVMRNKWTAMFISIMLGIIVSLVDEGIVQAASGRTSSMFDIIVDCSGILTAFIVLALYMSLSVKSRK